MLAIFAEERLDIAKFTCNICDKLTALKHRAVNKFKIEPHFGGAFGVIEVYMLDEYDGFDEHPDF